jgi:beta-galactosidase
LLEQPLTLEPCARLPRTFEIGESEFLLDGRPILIRCGEIHFPRVPREYWRHRLKMCRALGLNAVCAYLFWNFHEWNEGCFDWSGQADAAEFCRMAQEEGLWVLLRPGPYACAEWEMGGLPWWLARRTDIVLRSTDPRFMAPALGYLHEVARVLTPLQVTRGGPILMVQVENEYGSYGDDSIYIGLLRDALVAGGFEVPTFACNPPQDLANGFRPDLFQVVNFGAGAARTAFAALREIQPTGPLMNGEYYPAWFDMWGRRHHVAAPAPIAAELEHMLENRHSFSIYMAHGGTSFGLWAGADRPFSPDTTSYDYDAPISEAGWITPKFDMIRRVAVRHLEAGERLPDPPEPKPVIEIPPILLNECAPLFSNLPAPVLDESPRPMEEYGHGRGAILYRTVLPAGPSATLTVKAAHDFTWAYIGGKPVGFMDRRRQSYRLELPARESATRLDLLVYAMGRVNFGKEVLDRKGIHGPVQLGGQELNGWEVFRLPLDLDPLHKLDFQAPASGPAFWRGSFDLDSTGDSFLDMRPWGKGVVWVNGNMLGRYWQIGPAQTLYLPRPWLKVGRNEVVVLDLVGPRERVLVGLKEPILDDLRLHLDFPAPGRATGTFQPTEPLASAISSRETGWQHVGFGNPSRGRYLCFEIDPLAGAPGLVAELDAIAESGRSLSRDTWRVLWVSSEETNYEAGEAVNAIDGQTATSWRSERGALGPHRLVIDLGRSEMLTGARVLPAGDGAAPCGTGYRVYLSDEPYGLELPIESTCD